MWNINIAAIYCHCNVNGYNDKNTCNNNSKGCKYLTIGINIENWKIVWMEVMNISILSM